MDSFKGFGRSPFDKAKGNFFSLKRESYTVYVKDIYGKVEKHENIKNPWGYIDKAKKDLNVSHAWYEKEK